jgi:hypothetical protein
MQNTFSIRVQPMEGRAQDVRMLIIIDGQEKFQIGDGCVNDSFLSRVISTDSEASRYRRSDLERVIDYGFCTEGCCASTFAKVSYEPDRVIWSDLRLSTSDEILDTRFEFDRNEYEAEIGRALTDLAHRIPDLGL